MNRKDDREQPEAADEDAAVARVWRQSSDEQPPAPLDAAILAAARQSARKADAVAKTLPIRPKSRSRWTQWQPLAAAATVAGLAFVLLQTLPRDREVATPIRLETQASGPSPAPTLAPPPEAALETRSRAPARAATETPTTSGAGQAERDQSAAGTARSPAAESAVDLEDSIREAEADQRKSVRTAAPGEVYSAEQAAPAVARAVGAMAAPSVADWAARIEALHAAGDLAGAAEALREFRAADPQADSHLPESLRDWALAVE